jgi:hypothetical protein
MIIAVRRTATGTGLTLRAAQGEGGSSHYEQTIHPGESALGFTYEEWDGAVGSHRERRIELTEEGLLHPVTDRTGHGDRPR